MDAVNVHPGVYPVQEIWEDFLLQNMHHLEQFVTGARSDWRTDWENLDEAASSLSRAVYGSCIQFLRAKSGAPDGAAALSKSPSLVNLELVDRLPNTKTIVLLRDGRDVVASSMRTFGWSLGQSCQRWHEGAEILAANLSPNPGFLLVHYEDLFRDLRTAMQRILDYVGLDASKYDFERALKLPVRGSSTFGTNDRQSVHWNPIPRSPEFQPIGRWTRWTPQQLELFEHSCGELNRELGYV